MRKLNRQDAAGRSTLIDVESYTLDLDLTAGPDTFRSTSCVRFGARTPGAATFVELVAAAVHDITLNGDALDPGEVLRDGRIQLSGLAADNELIVTADCRYSRTGEGLHRFVDPVDGAVYLYSQAFLYDAHTMFACFDQPDLKATIDVSLTAPADWACVSNGRLLQRMGDRAYFARTPRMSPYLLAVVAGPYHFVHDRFEDIDLGLYCRPSLAPHLDPDELFELTKAALGYYRRVFDGVPYAFGKYDQLFVPEFNHGAMENPAAVTLREEYLFRSRVTREARRTRADVMAHEMAHMWFGNLVTMQWWDDLWLNESFPTYISNEVLVHATGYADAWTAFCARPEAWGYRQDALPSTHPVSADVPDSQAALHNFDGISYAKGAAVLRQLVAWVGAEKFRAGIVAYFRAHAFGNATLADFLAAMAESSGRDVASWAQLWLRTAGTSVLRAETAVADGRYTEVAVVQTAPPEHPTLRPHRIALGCYRDDGAGGLVRRERVEIDVDGPRTVVPQLNGAQVPELLLLNDDDLTFAALRLDERSRATVLARLPDVRDSLARALLWAATWDTVRAAELPATAYVELFLASAADETDVALLENAFTNVRRALDAYVDPRRRETLRARLDNVLTDQLASAEPGGDRQLALARALAAVTPAGKAGRLSDWLAGRAVPPGLAVDTDLRWALLRRLVVLGAAEEEDVNAELARDRTAHGALAAATAMAALPTAVAKASAWSEAVDHDRLSAHMVSATTAGFWQPEQLELCRPYVERYLADIPTAWQRRSPQVAHTLARTLFPVAVVEPDVLARTGALAADPALPDGLRRIVSEERAELDRALRARVLDASVPWEPADPGAHRTSSQTATAVPPTTIA